MSDGLRGDRRRLDPAAGPVADSALALRKLRQDAGSPTYAAVARRSPYPVATLSRAAAGEQLSRPCPWSSRTSRHAAAPARRAWSSRRAGGRWTTAWNVYSKSLRKILAENQGACLYAHRT